MLSKIQLVVQESKNQSSFSKKSYHVLSLGEIEGYYLRFAFMHIAFTMQKYMGIQIGENIRSKMVNPCHTNVTEY